MPSIFTSHDSQAIAVALPAWLDLLSVIVGSLSSILIARQRKLDAVGFVGLALLCGLGGGLIRDVAMQQGGVYMLSSPYAIPAAITGGLVGFLFPGLVDRAQTPLEWADIVAVGLFAVVGTDKAVVYDLLPLSAILMGTITGVGGGMLRDVFLGDVPRIFQRSNLYAVCAMCGSLCYYLAVQCSVGKIWASVLCVLVTVGMRRWSLHYNVLTPSEVDLSPKVVGHAKKVARRLKRK